jgi:hypothetical protein
MSARKFVWSYTPASTAGYGIWSSNTETPPSSPLRHRNPADDTIVLLVARRDPLTTIGRAADGSATFANDAAA